VNKSDSGSLFLSGRAAKTINENFKGDKGSILEAIANNSSSDLVQTP